MFDAASRYAAIETATRTLGDPEAFWRVCDANDALNPGELEQAGRRLRVPLPQP